jgi:hypothetical protein
MAGRTACGRQLPWRAGRLSHGYTEDASNLPAALDVCDGIKRRLAGGLRCGRAAPPACASGPSPLGEARRWNFACQHHGS